MATYGLTTYKSDGTTVVLTNSSKSAVYARTVSLDNSGTGATRSGPNTNYPNLPDATMYYIDFPEYAGRFIVPIQIAPGPHEWNIGTQNGIPYIVWSRQLYRISDYGITNPDFNYSLTILAVFVK